MPCDIILRQNRFPVSFHSDLFEIIIEIKKFLQRFFFTITGIENLRAPAHAVLLMQTVSGIFMHIPEWEREQFSNMIRYLPLRSFLVSSVVSI